MNEKLEKPEPFGRGQSTNEHEGKEIKPEQLEMCNYKAIGASTSASENHNFRSNSIVEANANNTDSGIKELFHEVKSLDANRYATKKTIAQGMLDIALLTANASQLKYILQVGKQHEFYTLMLTLICLSIGLQILQGLMFIFVGSSININKERDQNKANIWCNIVLAAMVLTVVINIIISAFGINES